MSSKGGQGASSTSAFAKLMTDPSFGHLPPCHCLTNLCMWLSDVFQGHKVCTASRMIEEKDEVVAVLYKQGSSEVFLTSMAWTGILPMSETIPVRTHYVWRVLSPNYCLSVRHITLR